MESAGGNPHCILSVTSKPNLKPIERRSGKRIRKYFREYCSNTSIHGLRYLAEKRSLCERLLWGMLIVTSVVACGYMISRIYKKYDQSPVIVSFATKESPIFNIPFPAVTICPMSRASGIKFNYTSVIHKIQDSENVTAEEELNGQYFSLLCEEGMRYFPDNKTFTDEFFERIDLLKAPMSAFMCEFMGNTMPCRRIFKRIILDKGICYTFNMLDREEIYRENVVHYSNYHKNTNASKWNIDDGYSTDSKVETFPKRALLAGADNGLQIIFIHSTRNTDYLCVEDVQGYSVLLHSPHTIPLLKKQYFQVPFDASVIAAIQPKMMITSEEVKKYDPIDRECYFANEMPLKFFKIYTPENCRLECLANFTLKKCGCVNFYMPRDNTTSICGNGNFQCMKRAERELKEIELNILINVDEEEGTDDFCDCMPLCTELSYDMEQSQSEWNWNEQFRALRLPGYDERKKRIKFAKLSVFFKLEQFLTSQRNELYGPTDFLANFGGLLGLFTGFSLLSFMEIIYFLTVRIFCNLRQYKVWIGAAD